MFCLDGAHEQADRKCAYVKIAFIRSVLLSTKKFQKKSVTGLKRLLIHPLKRPESSQQKAMVLAVSSHPSDTKEKQVHCNYHIYIICTSRTYKLS